MVRSMAIRRYHHMGSLDSGMNNTDGIAKAVFGGMGNMQMVHTGILESVPIVSPHILEGRGCVSSSYRLIRISADNIMRANFCWDSRCANCSYGLAVGSIAI